MIKNNKIKKVTEHYGITLIALVITIIILLILSAVVINLVFGDNGIIKRTEEARFKSKMSAISEEWDLYTTNLTIAGESTKIYAGEILKEIIVNEELQVEESNVQNIRKLIKNVGSTQEEYVMVYEGYLYYVSQSEIKNNAKQVKWCEELGIRIWEYAGNTNTGMNVVNGNYELVNGVYLCTPQLNMGFSKEHTRYLKLQNENLVPGNWINKKPDSDWYDYKNSKWANIYVENNGVESYYVWIPRYVYKLDSTTQTSDVKFIDVDNSYIDAETGDEMTWDELVDAGYKLPEAFWWDNNSDGIEDVGEQLPGYWMSKYQLSNLAGYTVDYNTAATVTSITIQNITINTTKTVAKYTYAINGTIVHESTNGEAYTIKNLAKGNKAVNVTALDENGEIIGSMTRLFEVADVNEPDTTAFDPDTTFYVYWDEDGNEHNEIPISMKAPEAWYDYTTANWANIVTRNDGMETYYVWIPRYQYMLDSTSQKSYVKFIKGTSTDTDSGYKIPEAFWWDNDSDGEQDEGEQLKGYWMTKYQLTSEASIPRMDAQMSAGSNVIRIKDITGTLITTAETNGTNVKYEYYLNGTKKHEGTSSTENYVYEGLNSDTTYTVNIIARNKDTNEYIGAVTKKIKTIDAYAPNVDEFDKATTYYVTYNAEGNETRTPLTEAAPSDWYDYSNQKWANIVTTANSTQTYFVWIPRYEYKILSDRTNLSTSNRRIDVNFITTDITNLNCTPGYKVPEAFWWDNNSDGVEDKGEQLTGYWISKYQLN